MPAASRSRASSFRRWAALLAAGVTIPVAVVVATSTASSAAPIPGFNPRAGFVPKGYHPQRDWAGSQVAKHEARGHTVIRPDVTQTPGLDVSSWQGNVNWSSVAANGAKFAYVKATENTNYTNPYFSQQYTGAYYAGIMHGAYHFAIPNGPSATSQADYFVNHGGGWSKDGMTLPPMLDIEYNPYGATCYGLSHAAMVNWISAFINEVHRRTTRWATIYTTYGWWSQCTGNSGAFHTNDPLFIARYASSPGTLPGGWGFYTFWQYADSGRFPGDQDVFNGAYNRLQALANNT